MIREGRVVLWFGFEGGEFIGESIEFFEVFYCFGF